MPPQRLSTSSSRDSALSFDPSTYAHSPPSARASTDSRIPRPQAHNQTQPQRKNHSFDHSPTTPIFDRSLGSSHPRAVSFASPTRDSFTPPHHRQLGLTVFNKNGFAPRDLDEYPRGHPLWSPPNHSSHSLPVPTPSHSSHPSSSQASSTRHLSRPSLDDLRQASYHTAPNEPFSDHGPADDQYEEDDVARSELSDDITEMPAQKPPDLKVQLPKRTTSLKRKPTTQNSPKPSSFWGWTTGSTAKQQQTPTTMDVSPSTVFSDGNAPLSPHNPSSNQTHPTQNYLGDENYFGSEDGYSSSRSASPMAFAGPTSSTTSQEILRELQLVTNELANSIKREMELEDEVDRARSDLPNGASSELSDRTSDYYSDSGASSARFPPVDYDFKLDSLEKLRRKAEQDRAQMRVEMAQKAQEDLGQRRNLELQIQSLEEQLQAGGPKEIEDLRRRLTEEKDLKQNFEDILAGMREEMEGNRNERDSLRTQLESLKNENQTLVNARRLQLDMQQQQSPRFKTIAEDGDESPKSGLFRSGSIKRSGSTRQRSGSLYGKDQIPADALPERLKDVEEQRDALHRTLRSLIVRHDHSNRKQLRQIRILETERDHALKATPRRAAFQHEVQNLRGEINHLRQRADEALEQKWQCEKGLSGLKMDLDRAQQETTSLRELLQEHDISVPESSVTSRSGMSSEDDSLDRAFSDLQSAQASAGPVDADTQARVQALSLQVEAQRTSNRELRARLAEAVGRGEKDQVASAAKINQLQGALRQAEERVMSAQNMSEEAVANQEEHVRVVKDAVGEQRKRGVSAYSKGAAANGRNLRGLSLAPTTDDSRPSLFSARSPRLANTTSGKGQSVTEASRTAALESRVRELEDAAAQADAEMQGVVEMMNRAQIEVAELQMQRDEAGKQTRALERQIAAERKRVPA